MEKNVGKTDRIIRIVLALVFTYVAIVYSYWWFILVAVLLVTAAMGFCGPYKLLGINTCKVK